MVEHVQSYPHGYDRVSASDTGAAAGACFPTSKKVPHMKLLLAPQTELARNMKDSVVSACPGAAAGEDGACKGRGKGSSSSTSGPFPSAPAPLHLQDATQPASAHIYDMYHDDRGIETMVVETLHSHTS